MSRRSRHDETSAAFERAYRSALRRHLDGPRDARPGQRIGRRASSLGLDSLELARIHDRAAAALAPANGRRAAASARAAAFFADAVAPIEAARSGAQKAIAEAARLEATLGRRTRELAAARARLARLTTAGAVLRTKLGAVERRYAQHVERAKLLRERMRRVSYRLLTAQEEERLRISRDLHDAIGQTLAGINVGLAALRNESAVGSRSLAEAITQAQQLVEQSMRTVHQFAWELRPTLLDDLGLVPALRSYANAFSARTGVRVRFAADRKCDRLDRDRGVALFRVAQGALLNVERHARAKLVRVTLRCLPGSVRLEVSDDGRSFDVAEMERSTTNKHLGLLVMRERVEMVGGTFSIESSSPRGTAVRAVVPRGVVPAV